jgi:hypothetical protein
VVVCQVVCGSAQAVLEEIALQKLYQMLNELKIHPYKSVVKLPLLVDFQQKVGKLVLSITSCPTITIFRKYFKLG